jgi:glutaminyl-peptide cyclotransferase
MQLIVFVLLTIVACARQIIQPFAGRSNAKQLRKIVSLSESKNATLLVTTPPLSELLIPRVSGTPGNLKVQQYLISTFTNLGWTVDTDSFEEQTPLGVIPFNNIIVTSDHLAQKKLVLACHFDSKYFSSFEFIGATDSAAPCAILINIAQSLHDYLQMQRRGGTRTRTLQFLFFDGEEAMVEWTEKDSIYGARHLSTKWKDTMMTLSSPSGVVYTTTPLAQIDALILLDLLGWKGQTVPNSQESTQWVWDRIVAIQEKLAVLKLVSDGLQQRVKKGVPIFGEGGPTLHPYAIQVSGTDVG